MPLERLDHVNVRTANLHQMKLWYERVLGMTSGPRPEFSFPGAWMYVGDRPVVHLVGVSDTDKPTGALQLQHFALTSTGLTQFVEHLQYHEIEHTVRKLPGENYDVTQVGMNDFDGNSLHIDFQGDT